MSMDHRDQSVKLVKPENIINKVLNIGLTKEKDELLISDKLTPETIFPVTNPKSAFGSAKPSLSCIPPVAIFIMGQVMQAGADKYGPFNWRSTQVSASVYYDAIQRHLMAWWDGQESDPDTGVSHLGHAMAGLALILDGQSLGVLNDNRPVAGNLPKFLNDNTKKKRE